MTESSRKAEEEETQNKVIDENKKPKTNCFTFVAASIFLVFCLSESAEQSGIFRRNLLLLEFKAFGLVSFCVAAAGLAERNALKHAK